MVSACLPQRRRALPSAGFARIKKYSAQKKEKKNRAPRNSAGEPPVILRGRLQSRQEAKSTAAEGIKT